MQHAWCYGSVESAKCSTRETIKFFRQTGRRRGRRHGGFSWKQKEQRDLCRRGALLAGSDFTGDQLAPRQHKVPERDGDIGARTAQEPGCRLCEVRGSESQSRRGGGCVLAVLSCPFSSWSPGWKGEKGRGWGRGGGRCHLHESAEGCAGLGREHLQPGLRCGELALPCPPVDPCPPAPF